jgi:hypothetical protein
MWAFALLLVEIYSRKPIYEGLNIFQVCELVCVQKIKYTVPANVPDKIANVLNRCWEHDPYSRPEISEVIPILKASL